MSKTHSSLDVEFILIIHKFIWILINIHIRSFISTSSALVAIAIELPVLLSREAPKPSSRASYGQERALFQPEEWALRPDRCRWLSRGLERPCATIEEHQKVIYWILFINIKQTHRLHGLQSIVHNLFSALTISCTWRHLGQRTQDLAIQSIQCVMRILGDFQSRQSSSLRKKQGENLHLFWFYHWQLRKSFNAVYCS